MGVPWDSSRKPSPPSRTSAKKRHTADRFQSRCGSLPFYTQTVPPSDALKMVLVVEDDADIRCGVRDLLEDEGYQVRTAANGREALDSLAQTSRPCVILLDLMMPVMDGHQFLDQLRLQSEWAEIPVVVVSAVVTAFPGVAGFIKKPFDPEVLLRAVKKYCDCG